MVIVVLIILGAAFISKSITEVNLTKRKERFIQALYLAEAGADYAIVQLKAGISQADPEPTALGEVGNYDCDWDLKPGFSNIWRINSTGTIGDIQRRVRLEVKKEDMSADFFNSALYVSGDIALNGSAYEINGDLVYSGDLSGNPDNVTGDLTQDPLVSPLTRLDFSQLRQVSGSQGNIYDAARLKTDFLPSSFWYDEAEGIPNIVYVETDLTLKGNVGTVGGFFVVVGDVLTNPGAIEDTAINGNGQIEGCIYTTGEFRINGGGGGLNVNGGVWAGQESTLNGNANITYNQVYMNAIESLSLSTNFQVIAWEEL